MTATAIIPARGGSKRIPRKNIRQFHGRPMIAWTIDTAINSGLFSNVIVSTDDAEIAAIAQEHGAQVPFLRPADFSNDYATTQDVMRHAVTWLAKNQIESDFVCCLYATAPFLQAEDVVKALRALQESTADYAYAVTEFDYSPHRALVKNQNGQVSLEKPELAAVRSQDLPSLVHDAGQFYWAKTETWLTQREILSSAGIGIEIPRSQAQDIDNEEDWKLAEALFILNQQDF
ncbi:pseudaminic acid cytidylyltransferase [bacterium]|nr:pseudaminic acid cytidylyltransferase [bacterium]